MSDNRYSLPLAIKSSNPDTGEFKAYGSTFGGLPDAHGDIIAPGAFTKSLAAHRKNGTAPALLWHHDQTQPIGVVTNAYEDAKGLRIDGQLSLDTQKGQEAHALMKMGALAMSIGYAALESAPLGKRGRELKQIALFEVSAVAMPSNTNAKIISVKTIDHNNPRDIEKILRDAGISRKHAKRILSLGKAAFFQRDAVTAEKLMAASAAIRKFI